MSYSIRPLRYDDIPYCVALAKDGWNQRTAGLAYNELNFGLSSCPYRPMFYVAERDDQRLGMAGYGASWVDWDTFSLMWVCTRSNHRKQGIASALVNRCLQDMRLFARTVILSTTVPTFYSYNWNFITLQKLPSGDTFMSLDIDNPGVAEKYI
jgi:GNAT superfamily N-acetyltransferase